MINLSPPYYMINGVVVAPDHIDPSQYYYFPNYPHLAVDNGRPAIRLLVYKEDLDELDPEEESVAGFLYFDTTLDWPEETLKEVAQKIQEDQDLDRPPRLSPLLYKSGTVRLIFLDRKTSLPGEETGEERGSEEVEESAQKEEWVIALESSGIPSLYGDNRAVFSATLTKKATQLMYDAFEGFIPAGVVYDLSFVGMQRAFNVHVTADWETVYHHFSEKWGLDLWVFSADIEKIVDELIENQVIKMEASLEGVGEEGMENEFNAVRKELKEFVIDRFFKPIPNPNQQDFNPITETIVDFAREMRNLGWPSVGYARRELDVKEVRSIDIDYTVTRAVERRIAPQAHISLFFEDFGLSRDDVITVVEGSDDFFKEVEFSISANADFAGDGLFGISVDVAYGEEDTSPGSQPTPTWSTLLNAANEVSRKSAWFDPELGRAFKYRYEPIFGPNALPGPVMALDSGWREDSGAVLVITPTELYQKRQIEFQMAKNFPYALYPQVHARLRYVDPKTGWVHEDGALLDESSPRKLIAFRTHRDVPPTLEYQLTYLSASGPMESEWQATDDELILVTDPRPHLFKVRILVAGDRNKIQELLLDFRYEDPEEGVFETGFLRINATNMNEAHEWVFAPANPDHHRYTYNQTLLDVDGNLITTGWVQAEKNSLPVGVVYARRWEVQPELIGPPLSNSGLEKIKLHMHYRDDLSGYISDKEVVFTQPGRGPAWALELQDPSLRGYTYEVIYVQQNGFERRVGPLSSSETFLVLSSVPVVI